MLEVMLAGLQSHLLCMERPPATSINSTQSGPYFSVSYSLTRLIQQIKYSREREGYHPTIDRSGSNTKYSMSFRFSSHLFIFFVLFIGVAFAAGDFNTMAVGECEYTLNVQTGTEDGAGTDAVITVNLGNGRGEAVEIPNIQQWGIMGPSHDYFENGNLDTFTLRAPCISTPLCSILVMSNGSGTYPGWYLDSVEVTTGSGETSHFEFDQWLALDEPPFTLAAIRYDCDIN